MQDTEATMMTSWLMETLNQENLLLTISKTTRWLLLLLWEGNHSFSLLKFKNINLIKIFCLIFFLKIILGTLPELQQFSYLNWTRCLPKRKSEVANHLTLSNLSLRLLLNLLLFLKNSIFSTLSGFFFIFILLLLLFVFTF